MLGEPYYMEVDYMHDLRNWFPETPWRAEYEPIRYCTHSLGPLLTLFDEDLEQVSCFDTGGWLDPDKPNRHDIMAAQFRTNSNRIVKLSVSYANNQKAIASGHNGMDYVMFEAFLDAVANGGDSPLSLREGLRMSLPGVFAVESAKRGGELTTITYPWSE